MSPFPALPAGASSVLALAFDSAFASQLAFLETFLSLS